MRRIVACFLVVIGATLIFIEQHAPLAGLGLLVAMAGLIALSGGMTR